MNNNEYENKYDNVAKKLRIIGWIVLVIGAGCEITGLVDFFSSIGTWDEPDLFFLAMIGLPLIAVGSMLLANGYRKKIAEFTASQAAPVAKDFTNYMVDGTSDVVAKTAGKVAKEIGGKADVIEGVTGNTCAKCGHINPVGAKFCAKCGAAIVKTCPYCGAENDDGAKFCNTCGRELY